MSHNYYQRKSPSGENSSFEAEVGMLRDRGHEVILYIRDNEIIESFSPWRKMAAALDTIWSRETLRAVREIIVATMPDVAHFQNTFPLISPSAYQACRDARVPVVQTLRNYRLFCPSGVFFRDDHVCEDCADKTLPWPGILHRCYRESRVASTVAAAMLTAHKLRHTWRRDVDVYVALTEFARRKYVERGIPESNIVVKPNFVFPDLGVGRHRGGYAVFVGRLSPEKGIDTLLTAWRLMGGRVPLKIVGDGPLADRSGEAAGHIPGVEWLGRRSLSETYDLMAEANVVVFPSEWYETFGRVAIEAFAKGTPVIAANIGAVAELVEDGRTGLHFIPGDSEDLVAKVDWAWSHPERLAEMGREARAAYEAKYTAERNYRTLMEIYDTAIARARERW